MPWEHSLRRDPSSFTDSCPEKEHEPGLVVGTNPESSSAPYDKNGKAKCAEYLTGIKMQGDSISEWSL